MIYWISHGICVIISKIFFPIKAHGLKNLPKKGGFIFASNHRSNLDPFIVGIASSRRLNYMAKESLFRHPFLKFFLGKVGTYPVRRNSSDIKAIKETLKRLKTGPVLMFPEGTRKIAGGQKQIQAGIGLLALKSGVPVVPVFIKGSDKVLPPGAKFFRHARVHVYFGKPSSFSGRHSYEEVARKIMHDVYAQDFH